MFMVTNILEEPAVATFKAEVPDVSPIQLKSTIHIAKSINHIITVYICICTRCDPKVLRRVVLKEYCALHLVADTITT